MRPGDATEAERLAACLASYAQQHGDLPGLIQQPGADDVLIEQIVESQRRNRYVAYLTGIQLSPGRADPHSGMFDPIRAAILHRRSGQLDEAFWMIFLYTHFGKHRASQYGYATDVYGSLGATPYWTWDRVSAHLNDFRTWLDANKATIKANHKPGGFGNHRKYESLDGWSYSGTGAVVESYVDWVGDNGHVAKINSVAGNSTGQNGFDLLYESLDTVHRFGRTARFDYLMMANKVGLLSGPPGHAHLRSATGPQRGVRLLGTGDVKGSMSPQEQDSLLAKLEAHLQVGFDVLEDALCNWQKSPTTFKPFRG
ncbi:hypothetical protein [Blastococcus sp. TF02-8]|uniref:alpha-glutamyl/putrescinyl thymine pyrophosphorylase clade 3 protein n=1 Tax=Blastococcus sp. TF02-8 TaxID=2250574 RepID=UPI000DEB95A9|nr:hypothetical protein [Blastococcus sp. TF02-8]